MLLRIASIILVVLVLAPGAMANVLANPGFEDGPTGYGATGWGVFGAAYTEASNPPQFVPYEGNQLLSMFGNWSGPYNVSGIYQEFPASKDDVWTLSSKSRHWGGDPMVGTGDPDGNWVVQKIAWFNSDGDEIGGAESVILDGTFAPDVWHNNAPITAEAPPRTASVQALILYIQVDTDGGAAHIDNVAFYPGGPSPVDATSWGNIKALFR